MQIVSVDLARSIWFFPSEDLNPRGLDFQPILLAIKNRYGFAEYKRTDPPATGPLHRFGLGAYAGGIEDRGIEITELALYNDGISADTRHSTDATNSFLGDLLRFVSQHGLTYKPAMIRKREYRSKLVVESDLDMFSLNPGLPAFLSLLQQTCNSAEEFAPVQVEFATDHSNPPIFTFARRAGLTFDQDRYFSSAPVDTETHRKLVEAFEEMLLNKVNT